MKSKTLTLMTLSTLMVVLFLGMASAVVDISTTSTNPTVNPGSTVTFVLDIQATTFAGNIENATLLLPNIFGASTSWSGNSALFTLYNNSNLTKTVTVTVPGNQASGTYTGEIGLTGDYTSGAMPVVNNLTFTITVDEFTFCSDGTLDDSDLILNVDISNNGEGDDDEWLPLDTIEVEVELENDKSVDLDNVILEIGLFEAGSTTNIVDDMMWISEDDEKIDIGDIDSDEKESHIFEFRIDPAEITDGNYFIMVKAYPKNDEDLTCIDYSADLDSSSFGTSEFSAEINIKTEGDKDKMVVIDEESIDSPFEAFCGQQITFFADVYNIGDRRFDDQIMVSLTNSELGINKEEIVFGDLKEGEKEEVMFTFNVPQDAEEKQYTLYMATYYDWDSDDEDYDKISDDTFLAYLKVEGNCVGSLPQASVSASLLEGSLAGEPLVISGTISNTDDESLMYVVSATGYETWADSVVLNQDTFTLLPGESRDVLFTFQTRSDASGEQIFNIEVFSGTQLVIRQPVSVLLEKSGFSLTGGFLGEVSPVMWGMGILNLLLILIVIIVAVKLSRK